MTTRQMLAPTAEVGPSFGEQRLGTAITTKAPAALKFTSRPGVGTLGRPVQLRVNMFEIKTFTDGIIYQYDVNIVPDVPPSFARQVFRFLESQYVRTEFGGVLPVYDGRKSMYCARKVPDIGREAKSFKVTVPSEEGEMQQQEQKFTVNIKLVAEINMHALKSFIEGKTSTMQAQESIQALDIVLRHKPSHELSIFGRSLFSPENVHRLGGGIDCWRGYFQSVRPASKRLLINVDTSATAYYQSGPVLDSLVEVLGRRDRNALMQSLSEMERLKTERFFKGTKVDVHYHGANKRKYRVLGITRESATNATFYNETLGRNQSVAEFFRATYQLNLVFPGLPCFKVGNPQRNIMIPMEICSLVGGQRYPRKLNEIQTAEMIKFTAQEPKKRAESIRDGLEMLQYGPENEYLQEFGLSISKDMLRVTGRILNAPRIEYGGRDPVINPAEGGWNLRGKKLLAARELFNWGVVCFGSKRDFPPDQVERFLTDFVRTANETGMPMKMHPKLYISWEHPQSNIGNSLINAMGQIERICNGPAQLIMCILPGKKTHPYAEIKRISDTVIGIPTQCIQGRHTRRANAQYVSNVCLKINAKLGGSNSKPSTTLPVISDLPTIVFGADVSHPAPGDTNKPSICAVVASVDKYATKYVSSITYQGSRVEHIKDLESMTKELLRKFYMNVKTKPQRIIFYRDGLSEGQFGGVAIAEITSIKKAVASLENIQLSNVTIPVTYIAVQKRHHIRMFPMEREGTKTGNVFPGTVIDQEITHPNEFDFYLASHGSLLGTARPAHYYVLFDEIGMSSDTVQRMTYEMCYLFCRATRSVSIVPAVYYADILAYRARYHTALDYEESASGERVSVISESSFGRVIERLTNFMYFV